MNAALENPLRMAINNYIHHCYPHLGILPDVKILSRDEFESLSSFYTHDASYDGLENTIFFKELATPIVVCREVHHWSQCQKMGYGAYARLMRDASSKYLLQKEAVIAATEAVYRHNRFTRSFRLFDNQIIEIFK